MISIIGLFYGVKSDGHYLLFLLYGIYLKMQGAHRGRGFLHCLDEHYNIKYDGLLQAKMSCGHASSPPASSAFIRRPSLPVLSLTKVNLQSTASPLQSTAADLTASSTRTTMPSSDRFIN